MKTSLDWAFRSPWGRTLLPLILAVLIGIFSNFLVAEMTTDKGVDWANFFVKPSFYVVLILVVVSALYQRHVFNVDRDILKFSDEEFCTAYARSQLIPAQVDEAVKRIKAGDTAGFTAALNQIKRAVRE